MATALEQLIEKVGRFEGSMDTLKVNLESMQKRMSEGQDAIRKVFTGNGPVNKGYKGKATPWGGDGASNYEPGQMGDFYKEVAFLTNPTQCGLRFDSHEVVVKSMGRRGSNHITKTALAEGTGNLGGFLVPPEYKNELYRAVGEKSFLRDKVRTQPMAYREFNYPALDQGFTPSAGQSAYYGGMIWSWEPEGSNYNTLAQTNPAFRNIKLVARDSVGITVSSNQLLQDSPLVVESILNGLFQDSVAWNYDWYMINGTGANQPQGMLNSPCTLTANSGFDAHPTLLGYAKMLSKLLPASWDNACWLMHPSNIPDLVTMTDKTEAGGSSAGFLVWLNQLDGGASKKIPALFLGLPIYFTEKVPAIGSAVVGSSMLIDPSMYLLGDRMDLQVESSPFPLFQNNQMMWRIITRWDGQTLLNKPITLADGVFQVSSVITNTLSV